MISIVICETKQIAIYISKRLISSLATYFIHKKGRITTRFKNYAVLINDFTKCKASMISIIARNKRAMSSWKIQDVIDDAQVVKLVKMDVPSVSSPLNPPVFEVNNTGTLNNASMLSSFQHFLQRFNYISSEINQEYTNGNSSNPIRYYKPVSTIYKLKYICICICHLFAPVTQ